jgi:hypothetical protein
VRIRGWICPAEKQNILVAPARQAPFKSVGVLALLIFGGVTNM